MNETSLKYNVARAKDLVSSDSWCYSAIHKENVAPKKGKKRKKNSISIMATRLVLHELKSINGVAL